MRHITMPLDIASLPKQKYQNEVRSQITLKHQYPNIQTLNINTPLIQVYLVFNKLNLTGISGVQMAQRFAST